MKGRKKATSKAFLLSLFAFSFPTFFVAKMNLLGPPSLQFGVKHRKCIGTALLPPLFLDTTTFTLGLQFLFMLVLK